MAPKEYILIAEDAAVNRKMLVRLLSSDYSVLEAENGREALEILRKYGKNLSAVILDLVMPVLDGYGFLRAVQDMEEYRDLPIIVATGNGGEESEVDALKLGAWDFITKPYNAEIIKFRLRNAIDRSQLSAFQRLKYLAEFDTLTGIYNKSEFFRATRRMLDACPDVNFAFVRLDIDRFQLINSFFGMEEGDKLLCFIAGLIRRAYSGANYIYGRMEADVFAVCFAYDTQEQVLNNLEASKERIRAYNRSFDIVPIFGVYFLDDLSLPVSEMLNRAELAAKTRKGNYLDTTAVYDPAMRLRLEKEQEIISEMADALKEKQFLIYFQPKYALATNLPAGAEALVRWMHPQKGLIPPGDFIPIFEKNGLVSKLDYYVWENVCVLLHRWMEQGLKPDPISVNVSRVNLYNPNLVGIISALTEKYQVPPRLLQLELTESAYMDNPTMMEKVVEQLHAAGFTVLMDDFGSGYSSLSVLKDVDVDVLKIDMRFFEKTRVSGRGENIVASIIRMAKWLALPVTAEGVETWEQVDFLRGVGCDYVQGYYFAKPMTLDNYAALLRDNRAQPRATDYTERYAGLNPDRLWSLEPEMLLLFSDDPSPKAICEFDGDTLELLRVNKAFKDLFGFGNSAADAAPFNFVLPEYHGRVLESCRACVKKQGTEKCEYRRLTQDGRKLWIRLTLQYMQRVGTKYIVMAHMEDATELKLLEMKYGGEKADGAAPDRFALKNIFSASDARQLLIFLRQIFDVARLVDPVNTALVELPESGGIEYTPYVCFQVWRKGTRCENCVSMNALRSGCQMSKYEYIKNDIFYVVSNPVTLEDADGVRHKFVLELASHVSDHLTMSRPEEKTLTQMIEETQRKIYTDDLTGAYNRRYLSEMLFYHRGQKTLSGKLGLVLLDLKGFKKINDRRGHEAGDQLLIATAHKLQESVRQCDSVIRYGGDEFVVTLCDCTQEQVGVAVERMRRALGAIRRGDGEMGVQADFGSAYTSSFGAAYEEVLELLRRADAAMYEEKSRRGADAPDSEQKG